MVTEVDMSSYYGKDPGAAKFGNFINYYTFHKSTERIARLHASMFPIATDDIVCLDIGCNTGELTREVHQYLKQNIYPKSKIHILAIDIDPNMIERANDQTNVTDILFIKSDIMNEEDQKTIQHYLHLHKREIFDIVFCFSVTMWIHLNKGDEKFLEFLKYIKEHTRAIVIEPQPWKCYRNAQRRMKKSGTSFPLYESLKIRSNVESFIEQNIVSSGLTKVYESSPSKWNRIIQSFQK